MEAVFNYFFFLSLNLSFFYIVLYVLDCSCTCTCIHVYIHCTNVTVSRPSLLSWNGMETKIIRTRTVICCNISISSYSSACEGERGEREGEETRLRKRGKERGQEWNGVGREGRGRGKGGSGEEGTEGYKENANKQITAGFCTAPNIKSISNRWQMRMDGC